MDKTQEIFKSAKEEFIDNYKGKLGIHRIKKANIKEVKTIDWARATMSSKVEYGEKFKKEDDEMQKAILIHELGHIYDVKVFIYAIILVLIFIFWSVSIAIAFVYQLNIIIKIIYIIMIVIGGLSILFMSGMFFCRLAEYEADKYVKELGCKEIFIEFLKMEDDGRLDNIFKEIISSHPSNKKRIKRLKK